MKDKSQKHDISTLVNNRHFYFGLTNAHPIIDLIDSIIYNKRYFKKITFFALLFTSKEEGLILSPVAEKMG